MRRQIYSHERNTGRANTVYRAYILTSLDCHRRRGFTEHLPRPPRQQRCFFVLKLPLFSPRLPSIPLSDLPSLTGYCRRDENNNESSVQSEPPSGTLHVYLALSF